MTDSAQDDIRNPELAPPQRFTAELAELAWIGPAAVQITLAPAAGAPPLSFYAGQFVRLAFPGLPRRDYSIASPPDRTNLDFIIRLGESGVVSDYLRRHARVGDRIGVEGPFGDAYWRPELAEPVLAIGGGAGLGPMKAIVETALGHGHPGPIGLYFGARTADELYLEEHFQDLAGRFAQFSFVAAVSNDPTAKGRRQGQVGAVAAGDHLDLSEVRIYIAGPPPMVEAALPLLKARGAADDKLHADAF